jgi:exopolyphosphatase / guanosine-5'-triphosphate,3'-diphosphate pyrophosphatase
VRIAVVDIGTNTTRVLVADVEDGRLTELERRSKVTRLGDGVDSSGRLGDAAIERVIAVLDEYKALADPLEPDERIALATSATRDAANGDEFRQLLHDRYGFDARIISGDEEARLTFLGATAHRPPDEGPLVVIDIGGGSTEYVVGSPGDDPTFAVSTQAGSVRQTERHLHHDPPMEDELEELRAEIRQIVDTSVPEQIRASVADGVAVAGTPTSMAAIDQRLDPYDPSRVHGYRVSLEACERIEAMLASIPEPERRKVVGLHPERAPTIIAGAVILVETMRSFGLDSIQVGEHDILYGAALEAAR